MRRREFFGYLAGAALWPVASRAKQSVPVIGYLDRLGQQRGASTLSLFRKALSSVGYVEGRNIAIEFRWADGQVDRLHELAADLVRRRVALIVAVSDPAAALAAKAATATIPIVFTSGHDPVRLGLVASLERPGGNATGVTYFLNELYRERLRALRDLVPHADVIALLVNRDNPAAEWAIAGMEAAALSVKQRIITLSAGTAHEIDEAFAAMAQQQAGGLIVNGDRFLAGQSDQLIALAERYRIPTIYFTRSFVEAGGLMSCGDDRAESWLEAANYVSRILKGERPADLPVVRPIKLELVINRKAARALGLTVPNTLLVNADEVIE